MKICFKIRRVHMWVFAISGVLQSRRTCALHDPDLLQEAVVIRTPDATVHVRSNVTRQRHGNARSQVGRALFFGLGVALKH